MRRAFTVIDLLVVLAIVAVLAAILFPVLTHPRDTPRQMTCPGNLKHIGKALQMYVQDYDDRLPPHGYAVEPKAIILPELLQPYLKAAEFWACPAAHPAGSRQGVVEGASSATPIDYGYNWSALELNGIGRPLKSVRYPAATVAFADSTGYRTVPSPLVPALGGTPPAYRHSDRAYVGWLDGHVEAMPAPQLEEKPRVEAGRALGSGIDAYRYWNRR